MNVNPIFIGAGVMLSASLAGAHIHVTVNTAGNTTVIEAGYLGSETDITIEDGYIKNNGTLGFLALPNTFPSGELEGWFGGDEISLTSDFFAPNLDGGDFYFELADVTAIIGDADAVFAWVVDDNGFEVHARSDAEDRVGRSFHVGAGNHQHGQLQGLSHAGVYDVTLIAWDSNAVYEDSEPVKVRINTSPFAGCYADLNADGQLNILDFVTLQTWFQIQDFGADCNGDSQFTILDFVCYQEAFVAGCG